MRKLDKLALEIIINGFKDDMLKAFETEGAGSDDVGTLAEELEQRLNFAFRPIDEVAESVITAKLRAKELSRLQMAKGIRNLTGCAFGDAVRAVKVNFNRSAETFLLHNVVSAEYRSELRSIIQLYTS